MDWFPKLIEYQQKPSFNFLVMQFLGANMEQLKRKQSGYLSIITVIMSAVQMIQDLENVHSIGYIHRDIKPENFVIGVDSFHQSIYLIDFGLSKKYLDEKGKHIPQLENKGLVGTARYTSINSHLGIEQSRRDDLESLGYVLVYFALGSLPWQNFQCDNRSEKFRKILETKVKVPLDELCKDLPRAFRDYLKYARQLSFTASPDYEYLKNLFRTALMDLVFMSTIPCFDWCQVQCKPDQSSCRQYLPTN